MIHYLVKCNAFLPVLLPYITRLGLGTVPFTSRSDLVFPFSRKCRPFVYGYIWTIFRVLYVRMCQFLADAGLRAIFVSSLT